MKYTISLNIDNKTFITNGICNSFSVNIEKGTPIGNLKTIIDNKINVPKNTILSNEQIYIRGKQKTDNDLLGDEDRITYYAELIYNEPTSPDINSQNISSPSVPTMGALKRGGNIANMKNPAVKMDAKKPVNKFRR